MIKSIQQKLREAEDTKQPQLRAEPIEERRPSFRNLMPSGSPILQNESGTV